MNNLMLAFIPLFVAVDAIGVLPIFVSLTAGLSAKEKSKIVVQSVITALCLAVGFVFLGKAVFKILAISIGDFMIAGGILLFCIAIIDLLSPNKRRRIPSSELGFVPLGTPLIVGPAVLTTSLLMLDAYGLRVTLLAVLVNIILAGIIFLFSQMLIKVLGVSGSRALSKITSLLLAAIAVMMVRKGVYYILNL
ncbi:MAG: MarC family protein [Candidatus Omnitrophica bacterium]|nr:MarC family protein [Candidatus Omnitrophota bacterium]